MNKIFVLFTLLVFTSSASFAEPLQCGNLFSNPEAGIEYIHRPNSKVTEEINQSKAISKRVMQTLRSNSDNLKASFRAAKEPRVLELLCVGGGPACIAAANAIPQSARANSLVIEMTNTIAATFANADFFINTGTDTTEIPGSKTAFSHFSKLKFPHSSELAAYLQTALKESGVPTLLNSKISHVEPQVSESGQIQLLVTTDDQLQFLVKELILGTGLGKGTTKIKDESYKIQFNQQQSAYQQDPGHFLNMMHSDTFLNALKIQIEQFGMPIVESRLPRSIILIGNGDGARISLEALSRLNLPQDFKIYWIGAPYKNAEEYIASQKGFDRYVPAIPHLYNSKHIVGISGRGESVRAVGQNLEIKVSNLEGGSQNITGQMIVDATGYEDIDVSSLLGINEQRLTFTKVLGNADNLIETILGVQINQDGQSLPIYKTGTSAGPMLTAEEKTARKLTNPAAIYNNAGRVQALIRKLFRL